MIKKLAIFGVSLLLSVATFLTGLSLNLVNKLTPPLKGVDSNAITIGASAIRSISTNCGTNSTGTIIVAGSETARTSWITSQVNGAAGNVYLCRNATCTAAIGIILNSSTPRFEQNDGYIGPYSCIGASVTSTVTTVYSVGS